MAAASKVACTVGTSVQQPACGDEENLATTRVARTLWATADIVVHPLEVFFDHKYMMVVLFVLLVLDILIVIASAVLDSRFLESRLTGCIAQMDRCVPSTSADSHSSSSALSPTPAHRRLSSSSSCTNRDFGDHTLHDVEMILAYISIGILSIFVLEQLLLWYAKGMKYVRSLHFMDFWVVIISLTLEILVTKLYMIGGLIIAARLWRFIRTGHGAVEYLHNVKSGIVGEFYDEVTGHTEHGHGHDSGHSSSADADATTVEEVWAKLSMERWQALAHGLSPDRIAPDEKHLVKALASMPPEVLLQVLARDYASQQAGMKSTGNITKKIDACSIVAPGSLNSVDN